MGKAGTVQASVQIRPSKQPRTALPSQTTVAVTPARQACGKETRLCQVMLVSTPLAQALHAPALQPQEKLRLGLSSGLAGTQHTPSPEAPASFRV